MGCGTGEWGVVRGVGVSLEGDKGDLCHLRSNNAVRSWRN